VHPLSYLCSLAIVKDLSLWHRPGRKSQKQYSALVEPPRIRVVGTSDL
jgi:hypothetical protein